MADTLDEIKRRIARKYLGVASIHGIGLRRSENMLCLYTRCKSALEHSDVLREIQTSAEPFEVQVIEEDSPVTT